MKTKIFFFLATMMLCCASAFAQSGNNEPLQGDVNEDGIVDVADIAAIIEIIKDQGGEIYYWYVGTTQPTAVDNPSAWRTSNKDAGFSETVSIGTAYTWFAYPNTWNYSAVDKNGNMFLFNAFVNNVTKTSIPGYILLKSPNMAAGDNITITFSK